MLTTDKTMLFCIGAQKAGTSWLYTVLAAHPECHLPVKEVHYFDTVVDAKRAGAVFKRRNAKAERVLARAKSKKGQKSPQDLAALSGHMALLERSANSTGNDDEYLTFLKTGGEGKAVIGDITPAYATLTRTEFARMAELSPNARFLFLMRDPIDRLWSEVRMSAQKTGKRLGEDEEASDEVYLHRCLKRLDAAIADGPLTEADRSNYMLTLQELEAAVPAAQIMTVFFEDMFEQASIDRMCGFLGIAPIPAQVETVKFPGRKLSFPQDRYAGVYNWLAGQYDGAAAKFGDTLPARWRERMAQGQVNG